MVYTVLNSLSEFQKDYSVSTTHLKNVKALCELNTPLLGVCLQAASLQSLLCLKM